MTEWDSADQLDWTLETDVRCTHDLEGRLLSVSAAAARALGYTVEDLLTIPMGDLVTSAHHVHLRCYLDTIRRDGSASGLIELQAVTGERRVWEYRSSLCEPGGAPVVQGAARDVTERLSEAALHASDDRFVTAFYSSPIAMAITTAAEGRYVDVNEAFERQMGYARDEVCGHTSVELGVWPSPADRSAMIAALLTRKTVRDQNAQFRTKSGRLITTLYSAGLIALGGRPCVLAAIADITAQKLAEEALRESESKFRLLAETTQSAIFIARQDGTFCYVNPQVEALTGYSLDELQSIAVWDLVHADWRTAVRARARACWHGEDVPPRFEFAIVRKDGETRWLDLTATLIEFEREPAVLGTAFDITVSKRNEQAAKEHTALLQTLVANSPFAIMVGGPDHRVQFCNAAFERIFRYTADEVVGRDPDDLVGAPDNSEASEISGRVMRGQVVHTTTVRRRKDGSPVHVELHAVPLMSGNTFAGCFGIYQDITERIEAETKVRDLRDRLTRVQEEERAHVARELHDNIGQRLAVLSIQLAEAQRSAGASAPQLAERLDAPMRLIEEIGADVHRLSHRLHPSQLEYLGLTQALSSLCEEFARQQRLKVDFDHEEVPRLPTEIATCLYRVAQEAIRNAGKHSGRSRVRLTLAATQDSVSLGVSDSGRGFDKAAAQAGSGLGLVSMAERVRGVGGALSIRSALNGGTRIDVSIPLRPTAVPAAEV
jgi:PAS domain S-box-containing protein